MNGDFDDEDEDDEWVRTDIPHDTANSLRLAAVALEQADNDKSWWKWVIVSAHMAAASALVGYLMASDGTGALGPESTRKWREWHDLPDPRPNPPERRLARFGDLLDRAVRGACGFGEPADVADLEANLHRFNTVRNGFNHFDDHGWSIHIPYVLPLVHDAVHLVQRIERQGWAFRHNSEAVRVSAEQVDRVLRLRLAA
jgi:hypothetical protein